MKLILENWNKFVNESEDELQEIDKGAMRALNDPNTPLATYVAVLCERSY